MVEYFGDSFLSWWIEYFVSKYNKDSPRSDELPHAKNFGERG